MRIILFILLFVSLKGSAQTDYLSLSPYNGVGYVTLTSANNGTTISGVKFTNLNSGTQSGDAIVINGATNIIIENCWFTDVYNHAFKINGGSNITVRNCLITNSNTGVRCDNTTGGVKFLNNEWINMQGYTVSGEYHRGQIFQFIDCDGAGNQFSWNRGENFYGESYNQDLINLGGVAGTSGSPIRISGNIFRGGGPSESGGGFIVGDAEHAQYVDLDSNLLVEVGAYGLNIYCGLNVNVTNNKIYGTRRIWTNIGGAMFNGCGLGCADIIYNTTNEINFIAGNASQCSCTPGTANHFWNPGQCTSSTGSVTTGQSLASMSIPDPLFSFIDSNEVWEVRSDTTNDFLLVNEGVTTSPPDGKAPEAIDLSRPIAAAGSDQSISISTATLSASGSSARQPPSVLGGGSTNTITYRWVQESGPNTATMSAPTSSTNNLSGLVTGTYVMRVVVIQIQDYNVDNFDDGFAYKTFMSDRMQITVNTASDPPYPPGIKIPIKQ